MSGSPGCDLQLCRLFPEDLPASVASSTHPLTSESWSEDKIQLTLEQHGLELPQSTYTQFFSKNTCVIFDPWLGVHGCERPTLCIDLYHLI